MKRVTKNAGFAVLLVMLAAVACGHSEPLSVDGSTHSDASGVVNDPGSAIDVVPASDMGPTADGTTPPPPLEPPQNGIQVTMDSFTIAPSQEATYCQTFVGLFPADVDVVRFQSQMTKGSHHLAVAGLSDGPAEPLAPCLTSDIFRGHATGMVYASQQSIDDQDFPPGIGFGVSQGTGLRVQAHYINTTRTPIEARVILNLNYGAPGEVTQQAGNIYLSNTTLEIDAMASSTQTRSCKLPQAVNLLSTNLHMHLAGVSGGARVLAADGSATDILSVDTWNEPTPANYPFPGQPVAVGDAIEWTCDYINTTTQSLVFGDSATQNEMCILIGRFYPIADKNTLFCNE